MTELNLENALALINHIHPADWRRSADPEELFIKYTAPIYHGTGVVAQVLLTRNAIHDKYGLAFMTPDNYYCTKSFTDQRISEPFKKLEKTPLAEPDTRVTEIVRNTYNALIDILSHERPTP